MTDQNSGHEEDCGCREYEELSRRQFITDGAAGASAMALASYFPSWLPRVVLAESYASDRDVMVSIFLRGGADGLTLCVPFGDPAYYTSRPTIAIPRPDSNAAGKGIALDNFFALPPAMSSLYPAYQAGHLAFVHACGQTNTSRSHFDAQKWMEIGKAADPTLVTGWLGRHLASAPPMKTNPEAPLRALGLAQGLQKALVGAPKTLPIANPGSFTIGGTAATASQRLSFLQGDYNTEQEPSLNASALNATNTVTLLQMVNVNAYVASAGVTYPNTGLGRSLKSVAALIAADIGIEAAAVDIGGWDTHASQNPINGSMFNTMTQLAQALAAFHADIMVARAIRCTAIAMSEFGRNVRENGSLGTDHGRATAMMALGTGINGGRVVVNNWPGLAVAQLERGQDLKVTLDFRDVLAEIVSKRLGNPNTSLVFPGYTPLNWSITR